jgi:hypothetical protein
MLIRIPLADRDLRAERLSGAFVVVVVVVVVKEGDDPSKRDP